MDVQTPTRPRPVVLVALPASRGPVLASLEKRFARHQLRVDDHDAIDATSLEMNQVARGLIKRAKDKGGRLHLISVVSDGGVYASLGHLYTLIEMAKAARVRVVVHAILDGVDVQPYSASRYVTELEAKLDSGVGRIGTVSGRLFGLDCEGRWDRIGKVYQAMMAEGVTRKDSALREIQETCGIGTTEGLVEPFVVFDYPGVSLVDTAIHVGFNAERSRELAHALAGTSFDRFVRKGGRAPFEGRFAGMTPYDNALALPSLFPRAPDPTGLPFELLTSAGFKQLHCGQGPASAIAKATEEAISSGQYDFVSADFANPDNTNPTGPLDVLDGAVGRIVEAARAKGGALLIMGGRDAANTFPFFYVNDADAEGRIREGGQFCDVAPTLLELLQLPKTDDVEGESLLTR
ncbi:MAG TPA: hypothetical protein VI299_18645 [Polyangiales bacterium]